MARSLHALFFLAVVSSIFNSIVCVSAFVPPLSPLSYIRREHHGLVDSSFLVDPITAPQNWPHAPQLSRLHSSSSSNSQSDEKNKRSKRRRRKQGGASSPSSPSALPSPSSYDASLEELIVDERKSALPRLEDLKMLKSGKAVGPDTGSTGGKPGILMPRELEDMKQKEKAKQATKGAPAYFDTMTKVTWAAIALLILAEVVAQVIPKASTVTPGG